MKAFGLVLIIVGLGIALIGVMNNQESDYDKILRQNRAMNAKNAREERAMASSIDAVAQAAGKTWDRRSSDASTASLDEAVASDGDELRERENARSSVFMKTLAVGGVFVVAGFVLRSKGAATPKTVS